MMPDRQPPRHRGYTLVELLIVVAILTAMVGLGLPSLRKFSEKGELLNAARQLRAELLSARLAAIESGNPTAFRYQLGGRSFAVIKPQADSASEPAASPSLETTGEGWGEVAEIEEGDEQQLPAGLQFLDPQDPEAAPAAARSEPASGGGGEWSSPVVFYPNGRALNAQLRLASRRYRVDVLVRGLTGTVQISPAQRIAPDTEGSSDQEGLP